MYFFLAIVTFYDAAGIVYTSKTANMLISGQIGPAIEKLLKTFNETELILTVCFFLPSVVILGWPPRRKQKILTASQIQGVS